MISTKLSTLQEKPKPSIFLLLFLYWYPPPWAKIFFVHNTIILNLAMKESEIWDNFSKSHKKNIKRRES